MEQDKEHFVFISYSCLNNEWAIWKMKTMNRIITAIALLLVCGLSHAQSTQPSFVKEYNERLDKTPLNLVEISISIYDLY